MWACLLMLTSVWTFCEPYDTFFDDTAWSLVHDRYDTVTTGTAKDRRSKIFERFRRIDEILTKTERFDSNVTLVRDFLYSTTREYRVEYLFRILEDSLLGVENMYGIVQMFQEGWSYLEMEYIIDESKNIHWCMLKILEFMDNYSTTVNFVIYLFI